MSHRDISPQGKKTRHSWLQPLWRTIRGSRPALAIPNALLCLALVAGTFAAFVSFAQAAHKTGASDSAQGQASPSTQKPKPPAGPEKEFPKSVTWSLVQMDGAKIDPALNITFSVDSNLRGSGFSGCNSWSATMYPLPGQKLATGPYAVTRKSCEKPVNEREFRILSILASGPVWDIDRDDLVITAPQGTLRFIRAF